MAAFVLVPGAGGVAWYWHRVVPLLEEAGHDAIAVDLPGDDDHAGLSAYADHVVDAIGTHVILVAQSLAGFTAPLVCARVRVRMLVFVNAMIPVPGETAGQWWENTGSTARGRRPRGVAGTAASSTWPPTSCTTFRPRSASKGKHASAVRLTSCSASHVNSTGGPTCRSMSSAGVTIGSFRSIFSRRIARERLHLAVDELEGGHLIALSNPRGLVRQLLGYL